MLGATAAGAMRALAARPGGAQQWRQLSMDARTRLRRRRLRELRKRNETRSDPLANERGRKRYEDRNFELSKRMPDDLKAFLRPESLKATIIETERLRRTLLQPSQLALLDRESIVPEGVAKDREGEFHALPHSLPAVEQQPAGALAAVEADDSFNFPLTEQARPKGPLAANKGSLRERTTPSPTDSSFLADYKRVVLAVQAGAVEAARDLIADAAKRGMYPSYVDRLQASLLRKMIETHSPHEVADYVEKEVIGKDRELTSGMMCALLDGCMARGDPGRAQRMWHAMWNRFDFALDTSLYRALTKLAAIRREPYKALEWLRMFETRDLNHLSLRLLDLTKPDEFLEAWSTRSVFHNAMLACARDKDLLDHVQEIYKRMVMFELPPNVVTLAILVRARVTVGDVEGAKAEISRFREAHPEVEPNHVVHSMVLNAYSARVRLARKRLPVRVQPPPGWEPVPPLDEARELIKILTYMPSDTLFNPQWRKLLKEETLAYYDKEASREERFELRDLANNDPETLRLLELRDSEAVAALPESTFDVDDDDMSDVEMMPVRGFKTVLEEPEAMMAQAREVEAFHAQEEAMFELPDDFEPPLPTKEDLEGITPQDLREMGFTPDQMRRMGMDHDDDDSSAGAAGRKDWGDEGLKWEDDEDEDEAVEKVFGAQKRVGEPVPMAGEPALARSPGPYDDLWDDTRSRSAGGDDALSGSQHVGGGPVGTRSDPEFDEVMNFDVDKFIEQVEEENAKSPKGASFNLNDSLLSGIEILDEEEEYVAGESNAGLDELLHEIKRKSNPLIDIKQEHVDAAIAKYVAMGFKREDVIDILREVKLGTSEDEQDRVEAERRFELGESTIKRDEDPDAFGTYEVIPQADPHREAVKRDADPFRGAEEYHRAVVQSGMTGTSLDDALLRVFTKGCRVNRAKKTFAGLEVRTKYSYLHMMQMFHETKRLQDARDLYEQARSELGEDGMHRDMIGHLMYLEAFRDNVDVALGHLRTMRERKVYLHERFVHMVRKKATQHKVEVEPGLIPENPFAWADPARYDRSLRKIEGSSRGRSVKHKLRSATQRGR